MVQLQQHRQRSEQEQKYLLSANECSSWKINRSLLHIPPTHCSWTEHIHTTALPFKYYQCSKGLALRKLFLLQQRSGRQHADSMQTPLLSTNRTVTSCRTSFARKRLSPSSTCGLDTRVTWPRSPAKAKKVIFQKINTTVQFFRAQACCFSPILNTTLSDDQSSSSPSSDVALGTDVLDMKILPEKKSIIIKKAPHPHNFCPIHWVSLQFALATQKF